MVESWITGQDLSAELKPETVSYDSAALRRLLDARADH